MKKTSQTKILCQAALINCVVLSTPVFANPTIIEQEQSYQSLVNLQKEKDLANKDIEMALKEKNAEIANYMKLTKDLELRLADQEVSLKERLQAQLQKRELASRIEDKEEVIVKLRGEITQRDQKIRVLEDKFKKQDEFLKKMVTSMSERLTRTIASLQDAKKMATPEQVESLVAQKARLDELMRQGMDHTKSLDGMQRQIAIHQEAYEDILKHNIILSETLRTVENKITNAEGELAKATNEKENMRTELAVWKRYATNLESDFNRKENEFYVKQIEIEGKYANTVARIKELEETNFAQSMGISPSAYRMPASLTDYDANSGVTAKLYQGLSERLKEANLNIKTSYTAGSISIAIEDNFLFSNDSSMISEKSKDRLHNLIVIYTEELFSDPEIREKISSVQFVGHASPRYKGEYLSPDAQNEEGYKHNISLSANRALEVVNYIFSGDFSDFPYKEELRSKIVVSGKGHQDPIAMRQIASTKPSLCGPYDCQKSRRVEIIFSLRADESIDN